MNALLGRRPHPEHGAVAIIVALLIPVVCAAAALAIDAAVLNHQKQRLQNALDAGALAGAHHLPADWSTAKQKAKEYAQANDPDAADAAVGFWEVVAAPSSAAGARCSETICAVPCSGSSGKCNTITLQDEKTVPFHFGPVIGIDSGTTGSLGSNACTGSCGSKGPMDVVFLLDRTMSMKSHLPGEKTALTNTLLTMDPAEQHVAIATSARTSKVKANATCPTTPEVAGNDPKNGDPALGRWMAVPLSDDYLSGGAMNSTSLVNKAMSCTVNAGRTFLAAPMKEAARYLLGRTSNSGLGLDRLGGRALAPRADTQKVIVFLSDGHADEDFAVAGTPSLSDRLDPQINKKVDPESKACQNFAAVAANAKQEGILVVTVGYGGSMGSCGSQSARVMMATAASGVGGLVSSVSQNTCGTANERVVENTDGDFFFCATDGTELTTVFKTAINQLGPAARLIRIP